MSLLDIFGLILVIIIVYSNGFKLGGLIIIWLFFLSVIAYYLTEDSTSFVVKTCLLIMLLAIGFFLNYPPSRKKIITWGRSMIDKLNNRNKK